ncbi:hypothetical protein AAMO2058_000283800 [Amorphochlora amoebiformis]
MTPLGMWASLGMVMGVFVPIPPVSGVRTTRYDAGMVPINANGTKGNMFYWFFPAQNGNPEAPTLLWLQGGPGASGMIGLFKEFGPLRIVNDGSVTSRDVTWCEEFGCIFVDQPLGTGFSVATEFAENERSIARGLVEFLGKFFAMDCHKPLINNDFYITGESYGGHFVPSLAYYMLTQPSESLPPLPRLTGISIGDGFTDPGVQVTGKALHAFELGLIDYQTYKKAEDLAAKSSFYASRGEYAPALRFRVEMETVVSNTSGINVYDVRKFGSYNFTDIDRYMNLPETKELLNIPPNLVYKLDPRVYKALENDIMRSNAWKFPLILQSVKVLLYQGQFDWKDGVVSNDLWIRSLDWPGAAEYLNAKREIWRGTGQIFGWAKEVTGTNLTEVVVAGAGHMVPMDEPEAAKDMISRFIKGIDFKGT